MLSAERASGYYPSSYQRVLAWHVKENIEPREFLGYYRWHFGSKGCKWYCYGCRKAKLKLYSDLALAADASYGITVVTNVSNTYHKFEYQWFCYDCLVAQGIIW